jgi:hypothetical protein
VLAPCSSAKYAGGIPKPEISYLFKIFSIIYIRSLYTPEGIFSALRRGVPDIVGLHISSSNDIISW